MKNLELLNSDLNHTFEEILDMTKDEFDEWCYQLRRLVVEIWDKHDLPPVVGYSDKEIVEQFKQLESFPADNMLIKDHSTGQKNVIRNTHNLGNGVNSWFLGAMMKTKINYSKNVEDGKSIYDFFARDDLLQRFTTYASRHFKRDSFYHYSVPVRVNDKENYMNYPVSDNGLEWILDFEKNHRKRGEYDYWICPVDTTKGYTGYNEDIKTREFLTITRDEIDNHSIYIPERCTSNLHVKPKSQICQIRVFELGQKIFPLGFKAFKISFSQYAVQFPPLIAKYLYEHYLPDGPSIVWDPSMGWGGRLLGMLSCKDAKEITYLGCDPNTEHNLEDGRTKYHEVYDFYCRYIDKGGIFSQDHNAFEFWQCGSEVIQFNERFQQYKGKVDLVMTSCPYFLKERYSDDETQSCNKFPVYQDWKTGFLYETLKTAYQWLKPGGYLIWNISDVKLGNEILPLVQDSFDICRYLGFNHMETLKLSLAQMPGSGRIDTEGNAKAKYTYKIKNSKGIMTMKYEPIMCFQKP